MLIGAEEQARGRDPDRTLLRDSATAKAVMVWPEGKENWSGGSRVAQQCGSKVQGRLRPVAFFKVEEDGDAQGGGQRPRRPPPGSASGRRTAE